MNQDYKTRAAAMVDEVSKVCMWPGGYPLALLTDDGGVLCPACVRREREQILDALPRSGWRADGAFVHWEGDPLRCDHCNASIPSAYGEVEP